MSMLKRNGPMLHGMNIGGDALGLVTGGAGKVATVAARTDVKVAVNIAT